MKFYSISLAIGFAAIVVSGCSQPSTGADKAAAHSEKAPMRLMQAEGPKDRTKNFTPHQAKKRQAKADAKLDEAAIKQYVGELFTGSNFTNVDVKLVKIKALKSALDYSDPTFTEDSYAWYAVIKGDLETGFFRDPSGSNEESKKAKGGLATFAFSVENAAVLAARLDPK